MPHHVDRFGTALAVLAGHGHIKDRLIRAFEDNLTEVDEESLPQHAGQTFRDLRDRVTAVAPLNGEGPICASVRKMSIMEADQCAQTLLTLYRELLCCDARPVAVEAEAEASSADVPAMLLKSV